MVDEIKNSLRVVRDLPRDDSDYAQKRQERINAEIQEIIKDDEKLKKNFNQTLSQGRINIESNWKIEKHFDFQLKQCLSDEFKEWFVATSVKAAESLCLCDSISNRDVLSLYQSTIRTGLLTMKSAVKSGLDKKFLLEYGHECALLYQMQTAENMDKLRETRFLSLCTNQPHEKKVPKHPILLFKVLRDSIEEEVQTVSTFMLSLAHRFIDNGFFALLADAQRALFV